MVLHVSSLHLILVICFFYLSFHFFLKKKKRKKKINNIWDYWINPFGFSVGFASFFFFGGNGVRRGFLNTGAKGDAENSNSKCRNIVVFSKISISEVSKYPARWTSHKGSRWWEGCSGWNSSKACSAITFRETYPSQER